MSFAQLEQDEPSLRLLQRSLERGRLAHAYLMTGPDLEVLETAARLLAKTLNCETPPRRSSTGLGLDSCDACPTCRKIDQDNHPDVHTVRPESKTRIITIDQMRHLMQTIQLKPSQSRWKVASIVAADRLNEQAANAFLKTLEEPPGDSVLILLSTDPQRLLETILSRCLRLNFSGEWGPAQEPATRAWLKEFSQLAAQGSRTLLSRYLLLSVFLNRLSALRETIAGHLTARSPLSHHEDVDPHLKEKWEDELTAAIEADYRYQRQRMLTGLQWWFRDVWLSTLQAGGELWSLPELAAETQAVASRLSAREALANLGELERTQRLLFTNVQEALALEVGLLALRI